MYSNYEENYKRMKQLRAEFDQDNVNNAMYFNVQNDAGMKDIKEKKLTEIKKLLETIWETMKLMGDSYLDTAPLYPKSTADKFIKSFEEVCTKLKDFKSRGDVYDDFIGKIDKLEESNLLKDYDRLFIAWTPIASRTTTENIKKAKEELAEDSRKRIETETKNLENVFDTKKSEMEGLLKKGEDSIKLTIGSLNVKGTKDALEGLALSVRKKKKWSVLVLCGLGFSILIVAIISYCVNEFTFKAADAMTNKDLSLIYVIKSTLPFFAIFSVLSYFLITQYKLIKSYLHLVETYQFKSSLIDNVLGLMGDDRFTDGQKGIIVTKLMDSIISFNSSGILDSKQENKDDIQSLMVQMMGMVSKSQSQ